MALQAHVVDPRGFDLPPISIGNQNKDGSLDEQNAINQLCDLDALLEVYTDGLAEPTNPGIGTYGFAIYRDGKRLKLGHGLASEKPVTNNYAEYAGLVRALTEALDLMQEGEAVAVKADSKLLINQMTGEWKFKGGAYAEKLVEARRLAEKFPKLSFEWIPREENSEADEESRFAYEEARIARRRSWA